MPKQIRQSVFEKFAFLKDWFVLKNGVEIGWVRDYYAWGKRRNSNEKCLVAVPVDACREPVKQPLTRLDELDPITYKWYGIWSFPVRLNVH